MVRVFKISYGFNLMHSGNNDSDINTPNTKRFGAYEYPNQSTIIEEKEVQIDSSSSLDEDAFDNPSSISNSEESGCTLSFS